MITKNSPTHEKLIALIKVQAAIQSLKLVDEIGLGTKNIYDSIEDLKVYEKQLTEYITGNSDFPEKH